MRSKPRRGQARRGPARPIRRRVPVRTEPGRLRTAGNRVAHHLSPRAADVLGVALIVLAVLAVLGVWFWAGGVFGTILEVAVRGLVGVLGYAIPVAALAWAVVLVRGTLPEVRGRVVVGSLVLGLGILCIVSVGCGNPSLVA